MVASAQIQHPLIREGTEFERYPVLVTQYKERKGTGGSGLHLIRLLVLHDHRMNSSGEIAKSSLAYAIKAGYLDGRCEHYRMGPVQERVPGPLIRHAPARLHFPTIKGHQYVEQPAQAVVYANRCQGEFPYFFISSGLADLLHHVAEEVSETLPGSDERDLAREQLFPRLNRLLRKAQRVSRDARFDEMRRESLCSKHTLRKDYPAMIEYVAPQFKVALEQLTN